MAEVTPKSPPVAAFIEDAAAQTRSPAVSVHIVYEDDDIPITVPRERTIAVSLDESMQVVSVESFASEFQPSAAATAIDPETGIFSVFIQGSSSGVWRPTEGQRLRELVETFCSRNDVLRKIVHGPTVGTLDNSEDRGLVVQPSGDVLMSNYPAGAQSATSVAPLPKTLPNRPYRLTSREGVLSPPPQSAAVPQLYHEIAQRELHKLRASPERELTRPPSTTRPRTGSVVSDKQLP